MFLHFILWLFITQVKLRRLTNYCKVIYQSSISHNTRFSLDICCQYICTDRRHPKYYLRKLDVFTNSPCRKSYKKVTSSYIQHFIVMRGKMQISMLKSRLVTKMYIGSIIYEKGTQWISLICPWDPLSEYGSVFRDRSELTSAVAQHYEKRNFPIFPGESSFHFLPFVASVNCGWKSGRE